MTLTPYYDDGLTRIYHGTAETILPHITNISLIITSPPYNLGTSTGRGYHPHSLAATKLANAYHQYADNLPHETYAEWQTHCLTLMWQTLTDTGAIYYNHKPRPQNGTLLLPTEYGKHLPLRQIITWDRGTGLNFAPTHYLPKYEWLLLYAKPAFRLNSRTASSIGDVWHIRPETSQAHPAPFPLALPARIINTTTPTIVCDPFAGSGTTLRAAADAGIPSIGIEQSEQYCELAAQRLQQRSLLDPTL